MDIESKQVLLSASTAELDFSNQQLDKSRKSLVEKTLQLQTEMKQRKDWVNMLSSTLPIVSGRMIEFQHEAQTRLQQFQNRIDYAARRIEGLSTAAADDAAKANESLPLHHHHHHQQQQPPPHAQTRMLNDVNKLLSLSTSLLLD